MSRTRPTLLALTLALSLLAAVVGLGPAQASVGSDPFVAGKAYKGDFPDPWVLRVGSQYYAYSTNTANLNLPVLRSKDLVTWVARASYGTKWWHNDGMPRAGSWAKVEDVPGRTVTRTWAPAVTPVAGRYVLAYTAPLAHRTTRKNCIGLATSTSPQGPFKDGHPRPVVCPSDQGAIDPQVYVAPDHHPYLVWKTEGIVGKEPTRIRVRRLADSGTAFADTGHSTLLLQTAQSWEGNVIENPALFTTGGRTYLFYSANEWASSRYAIGYAVCSSVTGPCTRPTTTPLMASGGAVSGPGGPAPFTDAAGNLRLGYAAWDHGKVGYPTNTSCRPHCNQRRLHVATLAVGSDGLLSVTARG